MGNTTGRPRAAVMSAVALAVAVALAGAAGSRSAAAGSPSSRAGASADDRRQPAEAAADAEEALRAFEVLGISQRRKAAEPKGRPLALVPLVGKALVGRPAAGDDTAAAVGNDGDGKDSGEAGAGDGRADRAAEQRSEGKADGKDEGEADGKGGAKRDERRAAKPESEPAPPAPPPLPPLPDPAGSASGRLAHVRCPGGGHFVVDASIAGGTQALVDAAHRAGVGLCAKSGFRTAAEQVELRRAHCGGSQYAVYQAPPSSCSPPTARPGTSNHEGGLAVDFSCADGKPMTHASPCFRWLAGHAPAHGLHNLPSEPWHWSVTGR
jgi:hypothetical protein